MNNLIDLYLAHLRAEGKNKATLACYCTDLDQYAAYLKGLGIDSWERVTRILAATWLERMREAGNSPATLARKSVTLRQFHRWASEAGLVSFDAAEHLVPLNTPRRIRRSIRPELESILDVATARQRLVIELVATGLRSTQVASLNLGDIDLKAKTIAINGESRRVANELAFAVTNYLPTRARLTRSGQKALIVNYLGERVSRQSVWNDVRRAALAAGIKGPVSPRIVKSGRIEKERTA